MEAPHPPAPAQPAAAGTSTPSRLQQRLVTRAGLALLMILVASIGAAVAYWIARSEQQTAKLHRQLTLGQMVELSLRQAIVSDLGFRVMLEDRQRSHRALATSLQTTAERIRQQDPAQAGQLDIQAEQEITFARMTGTVLTSLREWSEGKTIDAQLVNAVTAELTLLGFANPPQAAAAAAAHEGSKAPLSYEATVGRQQLSLWQRITQQIERLHHSVPPLAAAVVLFVAALVFLTIADLAERVPFRANVCLLLAAVCTAGSILSAVFFDPTVLRPIAFVAVIALVFGFFFWRLGWFSVRAGGEKPHLPEFELRRFLGGHLILRHADARPEKVLITLISLTVLASSWVGYWYAAATTEANAASHHAFATEVALNSVNGERWLEARVKGVAGALELVSARVRCAFASQRAFFLTEEAGLSTVRTADRDRERDCKALDSPENVERAKTLEQFRFDSARNPAPKLMADIYYKGASNPAQLYALADGYIGLAEKWEGQSAIYILALTVFAIALYLLGQSLGMGFGEGETEGREHLSQEERDKRARERAPATVLAISGVVLALGTFIAALVVHHEPSAAALKMPDHCEADRERFAGDSNPAEHAIQLAAAFYGTGKALMDQAESGPDFEKAAKAFDCAVAARKDFARAQYDRSGAYGAIRRADPDGDYTSFPTKDRLGAIATSLEDTAAALAQGGWAPTPRMLNRQGFNAFLLAVTTGDRPAMTRAIDILQQGIRGITRADGKPDKDAIQRLPAGELDIARMLYTNQAVAQLAIGNRERADELYRIALTDLKLADNQALVGSTITDLNILEAYCKKFNGDDAAAPCRETTAAIAGLKRMLLLGKTEPAAASKASVTNMSAWTRASRVGWRATFEHFDLERDKLSVVWLTQAADWDVWRVVQPLFVPVSQKLLSSSGQGGGTLLYRDGISYCLPAGRYRAEFYLNGQIVDSKTTAVLDVPAYANYRSREMNVAFCQPDAWKVSPPLQIEDGRHLVREFKTADDKSAAYLFTFFAPKNAPDAQTKATYRQRAWTLLKRYTRSSTSDDQFAAALDRFTGCDQQIPPGTFLHRSWVMPEGMVHVAFISGTAVPAAQGCEVLESIGSYYDRNSAQVFAKN